MSLVRGCGTRGKKGEMAGASWKSEHCAENIEALGKGSDRVGWALGQLPFVFGYGTRWRPFG